MMDVLDTLQRQLGTRLFADESRQAWLLVDAMQRDVRDCLALDVPDTDVHVVPLRRADIPAERSPRLVALDAHDVDRLRASLAAALAEQADVDVEKGEGFAIGGWLVSNAACPALVRHLGACMGPRVPGEGRKYFRWADRRVMEWMWPGLDAGARAALLGPVRDWWALDRCGQLVEYRMPVAHEIPAASWQLRDTEWQHALDCEPVQALLRGWQRFASPLPQDYLQRAGQAVRTARSLGLHDMADIVLVACYVIQIHPQLCTHPRLQAQVRKAQAAGAPLADTLAEIPDPEGWNSMREELTQAVPPTLRSFNHG
jgi:hypothetical protein